MIIGFFKAMSSSIRTVGETAETVALDHSGIALRVGLRFVFVYVALFCLFVALLSMLANEVRNAIGNGWRKSPMTLFSRRIEFLQVF
jgi:hypothetical protein